MKPRLTTSTFIERARERYGNRFAYENTEYVNMKTPVLVTCVSHGRVSVSPDSFLNRSKTGCPKCAKLKPKKPKKHTTSTLVDAYLAHHGSAFDYSEVVYQGSQEKVKITHKACGRSYYQLPFNHFKYGCQPCSAKGRGEKTRAKTKAQIISRAKRIHGDIYDYDLAAFTGMNSPISVTCRKHGVTFSPTAANHLHPANPTGCPECGVEHLSNLHALGVDKFIEQARLLHGAFYDYGRVEYVNSKEKVTIRCPEHGDFEQTPYRHLAGGGCGLCSGSMMERAISQILEVSGVSFMAQYRFKDCKRRRELPFDFAVMAENRVLGIIEHHGDQHFRPVEHFGGYSAFVERQQNDKIKAEYCSRKGIPLLVTTSSDDRNIRALVLGFCCEVGALNG